ncbi:MAG TPA: hypothetical protein VFM18_19765 [Methanosarcina sp.]|nr:hypothetical protein [Methanosarcina sp.]
MCCPDDWEARQPQDFVRGIVDTQVAPWIRHEASDSYTYVCSLDSSSSVPALAGPGCAIPGKSYIAQNGPLVPYSFCTQNSVRCVADAGTANCMTVGFY